MNELHTVAIHFSHNFSPILDSFALSLKGDSEFIHLSDILKQSEILFTKVILSPTKRLKMREIITILFDQNSLL